MSLRLRAVALTAATFVGLAGFLYVQLGRALQEPYDRLDQGSVRLALGQAEALIRLAGEQLRSTCLDWAAWDDTYRFVVDGNRAYRESNLTLETIRDLRLHVMLFVDPDGRAVAHNTQPPGETVLSQILGVATRLVPPAPSNDVHQAVAGIWGGGPQPMLVAVAPVLRSDHSGPARGLLVLGRFLAADELSRYRETLGFPLSLHRPHRDTEPPDLTAVEPSLTGDSRTASRPLDLQSIAGYSLLDTIDGERLIARIVRPREFHEQGLRAIRYLQTGLLSVLALCSAVFAVLVMCFVVAPIHRLSQGLLRIAARPDPAARLPRATDGELDRLVTAINTMLASLEEANRERQESQERYRAIVDSAAEGIILADAATRMVVEVNAAMAAIAGLSEEELIGRTVDSLLEPDDAVATELVGHNEGRIPRGDGDERIVEYTSSTIHHQGAEVLCFVLRDVTERRRLEARLRQAEQYESLGVLAGGIAHDFNNLLMVVLGNANLIRAENGLPGPIVQSLEQIETAAEQAAGLTRQMLAFAGLTALGARPVRLDLLAAEAAERARAWLPAGATLRCDTSPAVPMVEGDEEHLRQLLENLLRNAAEAIGNDGSIRVAVTQVNERDPDADIDHLPPDRPPGGYVALEVADTGHGIDPADRPRVFEPFFSTRFVGRGLGLAVVAGIVRAHHGALRLTSEPERGTVVRLLFPATRGESDAPPTIDEPANDGNVSRASPPPRPDTPDPGD